jgi:hypothetical protein
MFTLARILELNKATVQQTAVRGIICLIILAVDVVLINKLTVDGEWRD